MTSMHIKNRLAISLSALHLRKHPRRLFKLGCQLARLSLPAIQSRFPATVGQDPILNQGTAESKGSQLKSQELSPRAEKRQRSLGTVLGFLAFPP
jgi:hypothetical protein